MSGRSGRGSLLPPSVLKGLCEKLYHKRKSAALQVEALARTLATEGDQQRLLSLLDLLVEEYALSPQANSRKGGMIGLAAAAVGLGDEARKYLLKIMPSILNSLEDQEGRVRYYACESLYNIIKVVREDVIHYMHDVFDTLCRLCTDPDADVQVSAACFVTPCFCSMLT